MTISQGTLQQSIAANKFYPPRLNPSQSIARHSIISSKIPSERHGKKILVIEAQAGQGKTTLVHQFLRHCETPFIWYQIGSEDADPVLFLSALQRALSRNIKDCFSPQLALILEKGQVGPLDLQGCANILLNDIDTVLKEPLCIVFDDLHLLGKAQLTNQLLDYLIDTSPPNLHFILTSRHPLQLQAKSITKNPHLIYLTSDDLALDLNEIETLYRTVLKTEITRAEAQDILTITNGWIMGIVLAAHPFARGATRSPKTSHIGADHHILAHTNHTAFLNFFKEEIFSHVPERLHESFLTLSFLDEIDINLAEELTAVADIDKQLTEMADNNFFVYHLDDQNRVFRFHHLFQEFLQHLGRHMLGDDTVAAIYHRAADYYLTHNFIEKTLKTLRSGEEFGRMETVLRHYGLELVSANRTVTILGILQTIPEEILLTYNWLTFYRGLLTIDFTPRKAMPFFESCLAQFHEAHDEIGTLMALTQIIYFHFVVSGTYRIGSTLLERTRRLFERNRQSLPAETSVIVARNLAAGYCFFEAETESAHHYARRGCQMAINLKSKNFIASTRFVLGYIALFNGDRRAARNEIEITYPLASDPLVAMNNKLSLGIMQLCELSMHGNFSAFSYHRELLQENINQNVLRQTISAPYLFVWSSIEKIAHGKPVEALDIIEQGLLVSQTAATPHMTSQLLQWRALAHALIDNKKQALLDIEEAERLRKDAGGPFYIGINQMVKGATLTILGRLREAQKTLTKALDIADAVPSLYLKCCCLAYRSLIELEQEPNNAPDTIRNLLTTMREAGYSYFWGWEPRIMSRLLSTAVSLGIEPEFARHCALKRSALSFSTAGEAIPLLFINILGTFTIGASTGAFLSPQDLSNNQRELIGLLISSPHQRISQSQVQLVFWPDSPPEKARQSFDALTSRLRKSLAVKLETPREAYIVVDKGYVQLDHVAIDAVDFLHYTHRGLKHAKRDLWWQAGNDFTRALSFWSSFRHQENFSSDAATAFHDDIQTAMRTLCLTWSSKLAELNRHDEALSLLEKLEHVLAFDEDYVVLRHQLYLQKHTPLKAHEVLRNYRRELLRLGYSDKEADEVVSALTEKRPLK